MTQSRHTKDSTPIRELIASGNDSAYPVVQVLIRSDYPKHSLSKLHHTERMLEPSMGCTRIDQMG